MKFLRDLVVNVVAAFVVLALTRLTRVWPWLVDYTDDDWTAAALIVFVLAFGLLGPVWLVLDHRRLQRKYPGRPVARWDGWDASVLVVSGLALAMGFLALYLYGTRPTH